MPPLGKFCQFKVNTERFEDQWNTGKNTLCNIRWPILRTRQMSWYTTQLCKSNPQYITDTISSFVQRTSQKIYSLGGELHGYIPCTKWYRCALQKEHIVQDFQRKFSIITLQNNLRDLHFQHNLSHKRARQIKVTQDQ